MLSQRTYKVNSLIILFVILAIFILPTQGEAKMYKYKDESGKWHFTDDLNQIPERFREKMDGLFDQPKEKTRVELGGSYSIEINSDWKARRTGSLAYKLVTTAKVDDYAPSLGIDVIKNQRPMDDFISNFLKFIRKRFHNLKELGHTGFFAENANGEKFTVDYEFAGEKVRTLYYVFENSAKDKVIVTCRVDTETGDKFDEAFDEMVKSFIVK